MMLEKAEECPRCGEVKRWLYDAQICATCDYGNTMPATKHRDRALDAIASHLCSTDLTDGFCTPRDGKCIGQNGERPSHRAEKDTEVPPENDQPPPFPWSVEWCHQYAYVIDAKGKRIAALLGRQARREYVAGILCSLGPAGTKEGS